MGVGVSAFPENKRYDGVRFNVISVTRGWVGVKFPGIKHYVTLEWPFEGKHIAMNKEGVVDIPLYATSP